MICVAADKNGFEYIFDVLQHPYRHQDRWKVKYTHENYIPLPKGSIKKLIGRELTWDDEPVEI